MRKRAYEHKYSNNFLTSTFLKDDILNSTKNSTEVILKDGVISKKP